MSRERRRYMNDSRYTYDISVRSGGHVTVECDGWRTFQGFSKITCSNIVDLNYFKACVFGTSSRAKEGRFCRARGAIYKSWT